MNGLKLFSLYFLGLEYRFGEYNLVIVVLLFTLIPCFNTINLQNFYYNLQTKHFVSDFMIPIILLIYTNGPLPAGDLWCW